MELWKNISEFKGIYQVSNFGRVKSLSRIVIYSDGRRVNQPDKILKPSLHHSNYYRIIFTIKGQRKERLLSRIIAKEWIPNPENKKEVNHINGITTDNRLDNLEWVTPSENIFHYYYVLDKGIKRGVVKMDLQCNELKKYPSISIAVRDLNNPKASSGNIVNVCKGKNNYAYGFKWKYL